MFLLPPLAPATAPRIVLSPTDLAKAECPFRLLRELDAKLGRGAAVEAEEDPMLRRAARLGDAHEARVLAGYLETFGTWDGDGPGGVAVIGGTPEGADEEDDGAARRRAFREQLVPDREATRTALAAGADVVFQGTFFDGSFHGRADFLVKVPGTDGGAFPRYTVVDTKLTERAKSTALLQLAGYADQLLDWGVPVSEHVLIHHGSGVQSGHLLTDLLEVFRNERRIVAALLDAHLALTDPVAWEEWCDPLGRPSQLAHLPADLDLRRRACGRCEACTPEVARTRDVRAVHGISSLQRTRLYAAGVRSVADLASLAAPVDRVNPDVQARLVRQARAQQAQLARVDAVSAAGYEVGPGMRVCTPDGRRLADVNPATAATLEPLVTADVIDPHVLSLLPAPSPGDIYFDFEGDPMWTSSGALEGGLEYLFGLVEEDGGDAEPYVAFWAHDRAQEAVALRQFLRYLRDRRARYPDMHVYHYASYEKAALEKLAERHGEGLEEVLTLVREGVLVDLLPVVRHAVVVSQASYSIKKLEPLYMGEELRDADGVTTGGDSVARYAEATAARAGGDDTGAQEILDELADYNRYDCVSTRRLVQWLRSLLPDAPAPRRSWAVDVVVSGLGGTAEAETPLPPLVPAPTAEQRLGGALLAAAGEHPREDDDEAVALLGAALDYHRREEAPFWRAHFERLAYPLDWWADTRDVMAIGRTPEAVVATPWERRRTQFGRRLELTGSLGGGSTLEGWGEVHLVYQARDVPSLTPQPGALHVVTTARAVQAAQSADGTRGYVVVEEVAPESLAAGPDAAALPIAVVPGPPVHTASIRRALVGLAEQVSGLSIDALAALPGEVATPRAFPSLTRSPGLELLRRRPPRLLGRDALPPVVGGDYVGAITEATAALDGATLAVQGPPGTGKTYVGARVITRLVTELGWRVGVVAQSHAVVEHLLDEIVAAGLPGERVAKHLRNPPDLEDPEVVPPPWTVLGTNRHADYLAAHEGIGCVVGGTMWDFTNRRRIERDQLDLLVVDEAGQFSLANTVAASTAARRLLLLGDPQQLPQVTQGVHAEPVDTSALAWIARGEQTMPATHGYFIERTWRMHSDLCRAVSDLAYSGRLLPQVAETDARELVAMAPGVHTVTVTHSGNASASREEADVVVQLVLDLLGTPWRPSAGERTRPMAERDVLVVAPYNAQVTLVTNALAEAGLPGVRVGTVDKFQGQQAAVSIVTLAASSAADIPRGLGFLLNRNRLNVAVSRGQWAAVVVRSAALTDVIPRDGAALADLGAFLRLTS